jgi:translation initiation factor 5A
MDKTVRTPVNTIRVGHYVMLDDVVCRVTETHTAKPGKHGSAKMLISAVELISGKQKSGFANTASSIETPIINRFEYQLVSVDDNFLSLMLNGEIRDDITINDDDTGNKIRDMFEANSSADVYRDIMIYVMHFMDTDFVIDAKYSTKN